ncbi:molybdenum cofactor guanylyltransferase [Nocardioides terrisoli]|uniref:molybdenum cofactor guanylyltransferase n=1 Tax=Nocardioides terrisoli TaxID=3388267 RepID=UPI00287BB681|nr:NTP transferase domain-containing protein [Nocardioides marmorisolisilvae]
MQQDGLGAVILTGGTAARMDGVDKAGIEVGGRTLLDRALDALVDIDDVVVVGPQVITERPVTFRLEDPPGGGPVAGLMAGLTGFPRMPRRVAVLAVDMPRVTAATIRRLRAAATDGVHGALLVDGSGRRQYLCGVYDTAALRAAGACDVFGMPVRMLLEGLALVEVSAVGEECHDVDTWADLRALRDEYGE